MWAAVVTGTVDALSMPPAAKKAIYSYFRVILWLYPNEFGRK
jgi:hypothetical protein